jgi:subtilase family serine protease
MMLEGCKKSKLKSGLRKAVLSGVCIVAGLLAICCYGAESAMKILPGHVPKIVPKLTPIGTLPLTNRLNLAIGLPLRDKAGLDAFLASVYNPASTNYRHYLTPAQFTARFGPTPAEYAAVVAFAQKNNLRITAQHSDRLLLDVNGAVGDIQRAFHVTLRTYRHPSEARDFYAPDTEPSVDASLPISDISGLNNYMRPHPQSLRRQDAHPLNAAPQSGSGPNGTYFGNDFRAAYLPNVSLTGTGQMVGLLELDGFYSNDITSFESAAGITPVTVQTVLVDGYDGTPTTGPDSGNNEVSLDIEMAISFAPGLSQVVVFETSAGGYPNDLLSAMAADTQINQFSSSWAWSGGPSATTDSYFQEMAAQGQSFFQAVGDTDAYTVGASSPDGVDNPSLETAPISSPYITVVGGTELYTTGPGGAWSSETVWNWGLNNGAYNGTGGGVSSYYTIPDWQTNVSMATNGGSTAFRNIPDVACVADNIYVYSGDGTTLTLAGTSCAAPLWASLAALMNEQAASSDQPTVGFLNPALYALGESATYTNSFNDITNGNNVSSNSPDNYYATSGYDLCTGWGTPAGQALIDAIVGLPDSLGVTPLTGFAATGPVGGPLAPSSQTYLLTNQGSASLAWSSILSSSWLTATPSSGFLDAGAFTNVTVSLNIDASNLLTGTYTNVVTFSNLNTGVNHSLTFTVQVGASLIQNGGFETGSFADWTLVGNTIRHDTIYNAVADSSEEPLAVHSGNFGAFLGDDELATLSQTVVTVPGQSYLLSLWLDNPVSGSGQEFLVNWNTNGAAGNTIYGLTNPPAFTWTNLQFIVYASGSNTVVQFAAENIPNFFGLDDISLTVVPTPQFDSAVAGMGGLVLAWQAMPGLLYQVQYTTDLTMTNWLNLGVATLATSPTLTALDTNIYAACSQRFYRLVASP